MNFWYILQNLHQVIFDRFVAHFLKLVADEPQFTKKLLSSLLTLPNTFITVKITGERVNNFGGYRLAILMTYFDLVPQNVFEWIKRHTAKELRIMKSSTERCIPQVNRIVTSVIYNTLIKFTYKVHTLYF